MEDRRKEDILGIKTTPDKNYAILSIVAIVAIASLVMIFGAYLKNSGTGTTSNAGSALAPATQQKSVGAGSQQMYCSDTDANLGEPNYYYVKGHTYLSNTPPNAEVIGSNDYWDSCSGYNLTNVTEYYCNSNSIFSKTYYCQHGCNDGACNKWCTDSDGYNTSIQGTHNSWNLGSLTEFCPDTNTTKEYYCTGLDGAQDNVNCPHGCTNGKCNQQYNN